MIGVKMAEDEVVDFLYSRVLRRRQDPFGVPLFPARVEQQLRGAEGATGDDHGVELEAVYANAPVGLCVLDRDLRFVRVNETFAAFNRRDG